MKRCERRRKKEGDGGGSITSLPADVGKDILSRLPVKSIIQSRLVCRTWELLSRDPHVFHTHISRSRGFSKLLFFHGITGNELHLIEFCPDLVGADNNYELTVSKIEIPFVDKFKVMASCNGLMCLGDWYKQWKCIYSPFTGEYKVVPELDLKYSHKYSWGFGCHPITINEYKLVRIDYWEDYRNEDVVYVGSEVQVYGLTRNEWRSIGELPYKHKPDRDSPQGVLYSGRLHWLSDWHTRHLINSSSAIMIISFDLADDSFQKVPILPKTAEIILNRITRFRLAVLGGCLSIAVTKCDPTGWVQIWVMKKYGVEDSWVKQYSIGIGFWKLDRKWRTWLGSRFVRILCLVNNGKEILLDYKGEFLVSYNCDTGICTKVNFGLASLSLATLDAPW